MGIGGTKKKRPLTRIYDYLLPLEKYGPVTDVLNDFGFKKKQIFHQLYNLNYYGIYVAD